VAKRSFVSHFSKVIFLAVIYQHCEEGSDLQMMKEIWGTSEGSKSSGLPSAAICASGVNGGT